jgi:hypothetical protein
MGTVKEVYYLQKDTNSKYEYKVLYNDGMSIIMAHDLVAQLYSTRQRLYNIIPLRGEKSKTSTSSLLDIYVEAPIEDMNYQPRINRDHKDHNMLWCPFDGSPVRDKEFLKALYVAYDYAATEIKQKSKHRFERREQWNLWVRPERSQLGWHLMLILVLSLNTKDGHVGKLFKYFFHVFPTLTSVLGDIIGAF